MSVAGPRVEPMFGPNSQDDVSDQAKLDASRPVSHRLCARCSLFKPLDDFAWRRKALNQRDSYCRLCRAAYKKDHYARNRQRYIDNAAARRRKMLDVRVPELIRYLAERGCSDCGEGDPVVLEFDHLSDKEFAIARGVRDRKWSSVLDEIAKCEVVCANCHRRRTAERGGFLRAVISNEGLGETDPGEVLRPH